MRSNWQTFSSVFEQFSFTSKFFGLKMQKSTFFKEKRFCLQFVIVVFTDHTHLLFLRVVFFYKTDV